MWSHRIAFTAVIFVRAVFHKSAKILNEDVANWGARFWKSEKTLGTYVEHISTLFSQFCLNHIIWPVSGKWMIQVRYIWPDVRKWIIRIQDSKAAWSRKTGSPSEQPEVDLAHCN